MIPDPFGQQAVIAIEVRAGGPAAAAPASAPLAVAAPFPRIPGFGFGPVRDGFFAGGRIFGGGRRGGALSLFRFFSPRVLLPPSAARAPAAL